MDFHVKIAKDKRENRRLGSRGKSSLFQCTRKPFSKSFRVIGKASETGAKYAGMVTLRRAISIFRCNDQVSNIFSQGFSFRDWASLPFCAVVHFSRDSIHAFNDRIEIQENRGL